MIVASSLFYVQSVQLCNALASLLAFQISSTVKVQTIPLIWIL